MPKTVIVVPVANAGLTRYSIEKIEQGRVHVLCDNCGRYLYQRREEADMVATCLERDEADWLRNRSLYYTEIPTAYSLKPIPRFQGASA